MPIFQLFTTMSILSKYMFEVDFSSKRLRILTSCSIFQVNKTSLPSKMRFFVFYPKFFPNPEMKISIFQRCNNIAFHIAGKTPARHNTSEFPCEKLSCISTWPKKPTRILSTTLVHTLAVYTG